MLCFLRSPRRQEQVDPDQGRHHRQRAHTRSVDQARGQGSPRTGRAAGGRAEKKGRQPAQTQGKSKGAAGAGAQPAKGAAPAQQQQGKGKKAAASGPNARSAPLDTSVDAEGVIRPFGGAAPVAASSGAAQPASTSTSSEPNGSTPATTAAPSTSSSDSAQLPRQPPAFAPQQPQAQFAGRGRGRGGGAMRGRGGGRGGANGAGFNRQFQQQHAAALAAGYVPVPVELDANGNPIVDQFGYPVAAQQLPQPTQGQQGQAPPFDPRMLDPTRYWLLGQLEWWFSIDNLCRDLFMRQSVRPSSSSRFRLPLGHALTLFYALRWTLRAGSRSLSSPRSTASRT